MQNKNLKNTKYRRHQWNGSLQKQVAHSTELTADLLQNLTKASFGHPAKIWQQGIA